MKVVVAAFNQEKALVGAFSVITNLRMELLEALVHLHTYMATQTESHKKNDTKSNLRRGKNIWVLKERKIGKV